MENRSRGMQLPIIFLALGAALLASPANAFYRHLRTGRDIAHHHHYPNCPPDCPENLGGLQPAHEAKYPPIGKSAHYHPQERPPYYGNQLPYNVQPMYDVRQPPHNAPPVTYDGPPPSYHSAPPPPSYDQPPPPPPPPQPSYNAPPQLYNAPPPPYNAPPPPYNAPAPPPYNSMPPPPYNLPPPRDAPQPPSIYGAPRYNSPQAPFHQVVYDSPPAYNLPPTSHHQAPSPPYEQRPPQDNSQTSIQLIYEMPEQKNSSLPPPLLEAALKSNDSTASAPAGSMDPPLMQNPPSSDSGSALTLSLPDSSANGAPEPPRQDQIQDQIPNAPPSNTLPVNLPSYLVYNSPPPRTYQATMEYDQNPSWKEFRPNYRPVGASYDQPPTQSLYNRIPRNFEHEPFSPEYRPRSFYEPEAGGFDFDYGKPLRPFGEIEGDASDGSFNEFDRRTYEDEPPRIERHFLYPGDEHPYKPYRPYKRHDNYVQNHYLENEQDAQYVDAVRAHPPIVPPGMEISEAQLESIIKQAIHAVRQEEAEEYARPGRRYGYESPYAEEPAAFVTMQQPKRYQIEPYGSEEPTRFAGLPEARELDLGVAGLDANEQPTQPDLIEDLEQPPPTVTEPTVVDLLATTTMSR